MNNVNIEIQNPSIDQWLNILNDYADSAVDSATHVANSLNTFYPPQYTSSVDFNPVDTSATLGNPSKPVAPVVSLSTKHLPPAVNLTNPVVSLGTAPTFNEPDPAINLPALPSPLSLMLPVKDFTLNVNYDYPIGPDYTLPTTPTLLDLNLPVLDVINLPLFTESFPSSNSLVIPGVTFTYIEDSYSDSLLTEVRNELSYRLTNSTGLNPIVEAALWNRGRDRELQASLQAERTLLVERSQTGFSRPSGSVLAALDGIVQDTQNKIIDLSREITIKQAELEQENIKASIQQTIALEDILIRQHNNVNQRSFEVAKYLQDVQVEIFKLAVTKYTSEVEAYKAFTVAYTSKVQAELAKVEIFKTKIESEKLKGDLNEQNIRLYVAQLEGIKTNTEIYRTLVATISEKLKGEALKIEVFKTDIEAYSSGVKAKADEYSMYSEQLKGEMVKRDIFDSKVKAYASRIQAYSATSDVAIKKAGIDSDIQGLYLKKYEADLEAYIKSVQADQLTYQSAVDIYKGETELYLGEISSNRAVADLSLKVSENIIQQNKYKADVAIANSQINLASAQASYNATLEGKKAAGGIYQAIGSSALAAINVSASSSNSSDLSGSESHNYTDF